MSTLERGTLPVLKKVTPNGVMEWETWVEPGKKGAGVICVSFGLTGGKKQLLREPITEGKNVGRKNETTPFEQAVLEATARWNKQRDRKGYGETAKESALVRKTSPMLAQVYEKQYKKVQWDTAYAQPKLDGFRALARRRGKKVIITSRENQPMQAVTHVAEALSRSGLFHDGMILDGEMYCHGMPLNKISSACKRRSELTDRIKYHVYDVLSDEEFSRRHNAVIQVLRPVTDIVVTVDTVKVRNEADLMVCQKEFLAQGYEGAMLRHGREGYEAGKRSDRLLKVKTFSDEEFLITDYKLGRGKYAGMPVFTCTTKKGNDFDVLAPGNLEEKLALGRRADELVGKLLTVRFQYYTKTEEPVPFLPVAVGIRE